MTVSSGMSPSPQAPAETSSWLNPRAWGRWGLLVVLVVAGVAAGVTGSFVHRSARPAGIALALGAVVGLMLIARAVARSRWGVAAVGIAWLAPVAVGAGGTASGDIVLAADVMGLTYLFGGVVIVSVMLGLGAHRRTPATG